MDVVPNCDQGFVTGIFRILCRLVGLLNFEFEFFALLLQCRGILLCLSKCIPESAQDVWPVSRSQKSSKRVAVQHLPQLPNLLVVCVELPLQALPVVDSCTPSIKREPIQVILHTFVMQQLAQNVWTHRLSKRCRGRRHDL